MSDVRELPHADPNVSIQRTSNVVPLSEAFSTTEAEADIERRFGYRIGRFQFVLDKSETTEILIEPAIYKIPNSPYWLHGMVNLRSNILPVIDLSKHLGIVMTSNKGKFVLVIGKGNQALALLIDELPRSLAQPQQQTTVAGITVSNLSGFILPGVLVATTDWVELDIKSLLRYLKTHENHREPTPVDISRGD